MNHEEMSDYEINKAVMKLINPECVKFFPDVPNKPSASGFNDAGIHIAIADYCNNPADWAVLIKEITTNFSVEFGSNYVSATYCNGITMDPISERYGSVGRAMSICYLKSFDLLEDVKRLDIKNKKDEEACYSEGFSSAKNDPNPYLFVFDPWAYTPWKRGHAEKWETNNE